jgi:SAM-dependent methyltransferase
VSPRLDTLALMGEAHDLYADDDLAAEYDLLWGDNGDDVAMYEQFARRGDLPALELGVGTGRVALQLARAGLDVVGIDTSKAMLAQLRGSLDVEASARLSVIEADMRSFDLAPRTFDLIYCAVNTFQHLLTHADQAATLERVAQHLAPGGVFVTEMRTPRAIEWTLERSPLYLRRVLLLPDGVGLMQMHSTVTSPAAQTATTTYIIDRIAADGVVRRRLVDVTLRYTGLPEFTLLLERAGLRVASVYGDSDLSPYTDDSDRMVVVAEHEKG